MSETATVATELASQYGAQVAGDLEHPGREIKAKIVRLTLEGLVAKNQAQRTKQGKSVFYTTPETTDPASEDESAAEHSS